MGGVGSKWRIERAVILFPQPDSPTRANLSPSFKERSMPLKTHPLWPVSGFFRETFRFWMDRISGNLGALSNEMGGRVKSLKRLHVFKLDRHRGVVDDGIMALEKGPGIHHNRRSHLDRALPRRS